MSKIYKIFHFFCARDLWRNLVRRGRVCGTFRGVFVLFFFRVERSLFCSFAVAKCWNISWVLVGQESKRCIFVTFTADKFFISTPSCSTRSKVSGESHTFSPSYIFILALAVAQISLSLLIPTSCIFSQWLRLLRKVPYRVGHAMGCTVSYDTLVSISTLFTRSGTIHQFVKILHEIVKIWFAISSVPCLKVCSWSYVVENVQFTGLPVCLCPEVLEFFWKLQSIRSKLEIFVLVFWLDFAKASIFCGFIAGMTSLRKNRAVIFTGKPWKVSCKVLCTTCH